MRDEKLEQRILECALNNYILRTRLNEKDFSKILKIPYSTIGATLQELIKKGDLILDKENNYYPNIKKRVIKQRFEELYDSFAKNITKYLPKRYIGKKIFKKL